jgi:hypothetical protein
MSYCRRRVSAYLIQVKKLDVLLQYDVPSKFFETFCKELDDSVNYEEVIELQLIPSFQNLVAFSSSGDFSEFESANMLDMHIEATLSGAEIADNEILNTPEYAKIQLKKASSSIPAGTSYATAAESIKRQSGVANSPTQSSQKQSGTHSSISPAIFPAKSFESESIASSESSTKQSGTYFATTAKITKIQ